MKSGYKCSAKRIAAIGVMLCMLVLTCLTVTSVLNTKAEESIGQGHVNYDVTDLRIRTSQSVVQSLPRLMVALSLIYTKRSTQVQDYGME